MRIWIAVLAILSVAGFVRADELNDSYADLKAAEARKDPDAVMKSAAEVSKRARAEEALPKPSDAAEAETWKQRQEYGEAGGPVQRVCAFHHRCRVHRCR